MKTTTIGAMCIFFATAIGGSALLWGCSSGSPTSTTVCADAGAGKTPTCTTVTTPSGGGGW